MKITVLRGKDKSKSSAAEHKIPAAEMQGLPVRVTDYQGAAQSHASEALLILTRGRICSFVASGGGVKLYLSPRAEFRCIEPELAPALRETICLPCTMEDCGHCDNIAAEIDGEVKRCECAHGARGHGESGGGAS
jgi:hypothetical protein